MNALDVALRVAAALEAVGCEYFLGGSVASSLQGEPRATNDIDFVVAMMPHRVRSFAEKLGPDFEVDEDMLRDALRRGSCANIFYLPMVTKVDLFALGSTPYDEVEFNRRRKVRVRSTGEELFVKAAEDTVLRKLLWYRDGGEVASKQWRDVVEVLRVSAAEIDEQYLQTWAERLGIDELLSRARAAAVVKLA
ncbi:hypothetical protein [Polyangium spumosum]|uniref:hypothetical protein n=1 Tax=Polyangium spumosum TaxID=889282 RepID=UPI001F11902A|nr:hypothetical protein [Polyangium spumosum]